jgi:hypothetical protein
MNLKVPNLAREKKQMPKKTSSTPGALKPLQIKALRPPATSGIAALH